MTGGALLDDLHAELAERVDAGAEGPRPQLRVAVEPEAPMPECEHRQQEPSRRARLPSVEVGLGRGDLTARPMHDDDLGVAVDLESHAEALQRVHHRLGVVCEQHAPQCADPVGQARRPRARGS